MANEADLLEPPVTETVEEPSLRETVEKAINEVEPTDSPLRADEPVGKGAEKPSTAPDAQQPKDKSPEGAKPATDSKSAPASPGAPQELKAPASWKPAVREKWNALPREVQEEVLRREGDQMRIVGSVGHKIRLADEVSQHLQPFTERLQRNGANTSQFLGDVFETVKILSSGDAKTKAEIVANIVQSYGVDLRALDSVLAGRIHAPPPDPRVLEAQRRAYAAESLLQRQHQQQEQVAQQSAQQTLSQFAADPKNEFYEDVRDLMADLLERGKAETLADAYSAAVWANADTRKILLQREHEARVAAKQNRAGAARRASLSVAGAPRVAGVQQGIGSGMSLRETIAAAMDSQDAA
jgi:hypothetical protein